METLHDSNFGGLLEFLKITLEISWVVQNYFGIEAQNLSLLSQSGIIDPIRLNVKGDTNDYLFRTDLLLRRKDMDHFD